MFLSRILEMRDLKAHFKQTGHAVRLEFHSDLLGNKALHSPLII
jgi:hypothetical protein